MAWHLVETSSRISGSAPRKSIGSHPRGSPEAEHGAGQHEKGVLDIPTAVKIVAGGQKKNPPLFDRGPSISRQQKQKKCQVSQRGKGHRFMPCRIRHPLDLSIFSTDRRVFPANGTSTPRPCPIPGRTIGTPRCFRPCLA